MNRTLAFILSIALLVILTTAAPAQITPSPPSQSPPAAPIINPKAMALLDKAEARLLSIKTLSADYTDVYILHYPPNPIHDYDREYREYVELRLMKPNYGLVNIWTETKTKSGVWQKRSQPDITDAYDGKTSWRALSGQRQYEKWPDDPSGNGLLAGPLDVAGPLDGFVDPNRSYASWLRSGSPGQTISLKYLGIVNDEGQPDKVVEWVYELSDEPVGGVLYQPPGGKWIFTVEIYIAPDGLIHKISETSLLSDNLVVMDNVKIDVPMTRASFAFKPPPTYHAPTPYLPVLSNGT